MFYLFYRLRNPAAAVTILTMTLVLLQQLLTFNPSTLLISFCLGCISLPLQCFLLKITRFRLWVFANLLFTLDGLLIMNTFPNAWQFYFGLLLLSAGALSNIFLMPSILITGWFKKSQTKYIGAAWSISLGLSIPLGIVWEEILSFNMWFIAVPSLMALIFLMQSPPMVYRHRENPLTHDRPASLIKPYLFILCISASLAISISFLLKAAYSDSSAAGADYGYLLVICFVAVPFLCSAVLNSRGVFYQSVLVIFSCETPLLFMADYDMTRPSYVSAFITVYALACLPVLIPALSHRLYGHMNCAENYTLLYSAIPAGVFVALPMLREIYYGTFDVYTVALTLLTFLSVGLGCFFSAWKHRFVLLQTPVS